ncbi:MAG: hypothetical protein AAFP19_04190 [Bacteroidota bacterium]
METTAAAIIIPLMALGILLAITTYLALNFWNRFMASSQSLAEKEKEIDELEDQLEEKLELREADKKFFKDFANLNDSFRALTMVEFLYQIISREGPQNPVIRAGFGTQNAKAQENTGQEIKNSAISKEKVVRIGEEKVQAQLAAPKNQEAIESGLLPTLIDLTANRLEYEAIAVANGIKLSDVCPCPHDPKTYCDWSADMFDYFIVDKSKVDISNIKIFKMVDGEVSKEDKDLIAFTALSSFVPSNTNSNFCRINMIFVGGKNPLQAGDRIAMCVEMNIENNLVRLILCNIVPDSGIAESENSTIPSEVNNGAANRVPA